MWVSRGEWCLRWQATAATAALVFCVLFVLLATVALPIRWKRQTWTAMALIALMGAALAYAVPVSARRMTEPWSRAIVPTTALIIGLPALDGEWMLWLDLRLPRRDGRSDLSTAWQRWLVARRALTVVGRLPQDQRMSPADYACQIITATPDAFPPDLVARALAYIYLNDWEHSPEAGQKLRAMGANGRDASRLLAPALNDPSDWSQSLEIAEVLVRVGVPPEALGDVERALVDAEPSPRRNWLILARAIADPSAANVDAAVHVAVSPTYVGPSTTDLAGIAWPVLADRLCVKPRDPDPAVRLTYVQACLALWEHPARAPDAAWAPVCLLLRSLADHDPEPPVLSAASQLYARMSETSRR